MNVHQSRPSGLDTHHYSSSRYHHQQQQQVQSWPTMPPHVGFGRPMNPYDRPIPPPLPQSSYHHHPQQQQQQQQMVYAPPQAPHLANRHYQPSTNSAYYPVVYSTPYQVAPSPYYAQQSRHAFANSTGYHSQHLQQSSFAPPQTSYRPNESVYSQGGGGGGNYASCSTPQQDRNYSQERMRSQSRGRWNGQAPNQQQQHQQQHQHQSERSNSNDSIWRDDSRGGDSRMMGGAELSRVSSSSSSGELSSKPEVWNKNTYNRAPSVDLDHPSFDRPPHRSSVSNVQGSVMGSSSSSSAPLVVNTKSSSTDNDNEEYDLIPNLSPVPPPPAIEFSAVPLSDLATEMVWEACGLAVAADQGWSKVANKLPSLFNEVADGNRRLGLDLEEQPHRRSALGNSISSTRSSSPFSTPELFGAIGEGRTRSRKLSDTTTHNGGSNDSSPSSSTPGTPAGVGAMEATAARRMLGFGFVGFNPPSHHETGGKNVGDYQEGVRSGFESPLEGIRNSSIRRFNTQSTPTPLNHHPKFNQSSSSSSPSPTSPTSPGLPAEPSPAFRQFVKQVLTATLVAPEDLILALYYVASIPSASMIPPMANESRASAIKAAPFKILLGALMLANKTLQDNSYRNETFAAVSGIPLKDVNDLEVFVFGALGFDVAVRGDIWKNWIAVVLERSEKRGGGGDLGNHYEVKVALEKLWKATKNTVGPVRYRGEEEEELKPSFEVLVRVDSGTIEPEEEERMNQDEDDDEMGGDLGEFEGPLKPKTPLRRNQCAR